MSQSTHKIDVFAPLRVQLSALGLLYIIKAMHWWTTYQNSTSATMIEVFKTDVRKLREAKNLVNILVEHFPGSKINFDLDDCDKVLRVEGSNLRIEKVMTLVMEKGFLCAVLD